MLTVDCLLIGSGTCASRIHQELETKWPENRLWSPAKGTRVDPIFPIAEGGPELTANKSNPHFYIHEPRASGLKLPQFTKSMGIEQQDAYYEWTHEDERTFLPLRQIRTPATTMQLLEQSRSALQTWPKLELGTRPQCIEPSANPEGGWRIRFTNGQWVESRKVLLACGWRELFEIDGLKLPKAKTSDWVSALRPASIIQMELHHPELPSFPGFIDGSSSEPFLVRFPLQREPGEKKPLWAYGVIQSDMSQSRYTLVIPPEESEDSALVAKRVRKLKQAVNKLISPNDHALDSFLTEESVRFEEYALCMRPEGLRFPLVEKGLFILPESTETSIWATHEIPALLHDFIA